MEPIETFEHKGYTIEVYPDDCGGNDPRDWDNLGTMACWHSNYRLGDDPPRMSPDQFLLCLVEDYKWDHPWSWSSYGDLPELWRKLAPTLERYYVILPLIVYEHGNIAMSTSRCWPFNCPWDAGQVGWIYVSLEKLREEYSKQRISKQVRQKAREVLEQEVKTYSQYLQGEVYGYVVKDQDGETIDSCWGYFGSDFEYMLNEAKGHIDWTIKEELKQHGEYLKRAIKAGVPVMYREACPVGQGVR